MGDLTEVSQSLFSPLTVEKKSAFSFKELASDFPDHPSDWTIPEAFICLVLSAAFSDGRVAEQEQEQIRVLAHRSRTLKSMDPNELAHANQVIIQRRRDRPNWLSEACEALPRDMHLSVFAHCLDIALADGSLVSAEAEFLEQLIALLSIPAEDASSITRVVSLKNRY